MMRLIVGLGNKRKAIENRQTDVIYNREIPHKHRNGSNKKTRKGTRQESYIKHK
jgi:hypothetical protein